MDPYINAQIDPKIEILYKRIDQLSKEYKSNINRLEQENYILRNRLSRLEAILTRHGIN